MTTRTLTALVALLGAAPAAAQAPGLRIDPRFGIDAVRGRVELTPPVRTQRLTLAWDRTVRFAKASFPTCPPRALRDEDGACPFAANVGLGAVTFLAPDGARVNGKVLAFNQAGSRMGLVISLPGREVVAAGRVLTRRSARALEVRLPDELQAMPLVRFTLRLRRLDRGREFVRTSACPPGGHAGAVEVVPVQGPVLTAEAAVPCGPAS